MHSTNARALAPAIIIAPPKLTVIRGGLDRQDSRRKAEHRVKRSPITTTIEFEIEKEDGPALRGAIDEISNEVGGRLEGPHSFATEQALTNAVRALGKLRAAIFAKFEHADPDYKARAQRSR